MTLTFRVLGPIEVLDGDAPLEVRRGHPRALLAFLVLRAGETVSAERLYQVAWGDDLPANPANALQTQVSYLRRALGAGGRGAPIETRGAGYTLSVDPEHIDAVRFERLVARAERDAAGGTVGSLGNALGLIDEALGLWRGEPYAELPDDEAAMGARGRLDELRLHAAELRVDALLALGLHGAAVTTLTEWVSSHPLRERFHEQLVLALYRSGRQADALRAYARARERLVDELGIEPGPALRALERRVLDQDPALDWTPPAGGDATSPTAVETRPAPRPTARAEPPLPVTPLVGRADELARIGDLLGRVRVATLTGPAGAGKTRLALEVAHHLAADRPTWFVDLGDVDADELVAPTVAAALGASVTPGADPVAAVVNELRTGDGLLVLDTCEHVLAGATALVGAVVRRAGSVTVLCTSRRPLGVAGEQAWPVPPLDVGAEERLDPAMPSPAVELFTARAKAVNPEFRLTSDNVAAVVAVCRRLDGLPLAIELAAAHSDVLSPAALLARLENRFDVLVSTSTDVAPRQRTLRAAIDWSYGLLGNAERRLFARLSVFAGSFDLVAAEAVAAEPDVVATMAALVRHSLVVRAGDDRFRVLDSLRDYAASVLESTEPAEEVRALRLRHASHYATSAATAGARGRRGARDQWLAAMRSELPDLRAALRFAAGDADGAELSARLASLLAWFLSSQGMGAEAKEHLERALRPSLPPRLRAALLLGLGSVALQLGDIDTALARCDDGVQVARAAGLVTMEASGTLWRGIARWAARDLEGAAADHEEAEARLAALGDRWGTTFAVIAAARTALDRGDDRAGELAVRALDLAREVGDQYAVAIAREQLAAIALAQGDLAGAVREASQGLALAEETAAPEGEMAALHLLGRARWEQGDERAAVRLHLRALDLAVTLGHRAGMCEAVEELAVIAAAGGAVDEAAELLALATAEREARRLPRRVPAERRFDELAAHLDEKLAGAPPPRRYASFDDAVVALRTSPAAA